MKFLLQFYVLIYLLICCFSLQAQDYTRWVMNSGGAQFTSDQILLSASMGQSGLVGTFEKQSMLVTAGFQQLDEGIATAISYRNDELIVSLFPNPFHDELTIHLEPGEWAQLNISLYDGFGRIINAQANIELTSSTNYRETIRLPGLASGVYYLELMIKLNNGHIQKQQKKVLIE